jgi:hypothetical protein
VFLFYAVVSLGAGMGTVMMATGMMLAGILIVAHSCLMGALITLNLPSRRRQSAGLRRAYPGPDEG